MHNSSGMAHVDIPALERSLALKPAPREQVGLFW